MLSSKTAIGCALLLCMMLGLSACGFRPLYGKHSIDANNVTADQKLALVSISPIENRLGQELHNTLRNELTPLGQPRQPLYVLDVTLSEERRAIITTAGLAATREDLYLIATYTLKNEKGETLFSDTAAGSASYNVFLDPYNDLSSRRDAHRRTSKRIAETIRRRLAIYLERGD